MCLFVLERMKDLVVAVRAGHDGKGVCCVPSRQPQILVVNLRDVSVSQLLNCLSVPVNHVSVAARWHLLHNTTNRYALIELMDSSYMIILLRSIDSVHITDIIYVFIYLTSENIKYAFIYFISLELWCVR